MYIYINPMFRIPLWDDHSHTPNRGLQCEHLGYRSKWGGASDISLGWSASAAFCCVDFISGVHVRSVPRLERWRRKTMPWQHGRHRLRQVTTMALRPKPWHDGLYMFIYIYVYIYKGDYPNNIAARFRFVNYHNLPGMLWGGAPNLISL